jgi:hypothetical protein
MGTPSWISSAPYYNCIDYGTRTNETRMSEPLEAVSSGVRFDGMRQYVTCTCDRAL